MRDEAFHLAGNYAPVTAEVEAHALEVSGALPRELTGLFVRNGPNPKTGSSAHWFLGDGMLHGIRLAAGRAEWYRNRWVRTRQFTDDAPLIRDDLTVDYATGVANTHVVAHGGKLLALVESSWPVVVTPELETVGPWNYGSRLTTAMTAHPKTCPVTGELHFFGYGFAPPFLTYHVADPTGTLVRSEVIEVPGPTMIHDFAITEHNVVFLDLPVVFDLDLAMAGTMPYAWSDTYGARVGVMPRSGGPADVRWFELDPCYVFHVLNAFEDGDQIVVDVVRYAELWRAGSWATSPAPQLWRWEIDRTAGKVFETQLDDRPGEFPRVDDRRTGLRHRYGYLVSDHSIVRHDLVAGTSEVHDFGPARTPGEPVFAPAGHGSEDAGWLLTYVYDATEDSSDFVVLDASDVSAPPVATIKLPQRVPFGFHGSWVPSGALR